MKQTRQLAAIMFTDIVGYTALMGDDEQKAFEYLAKNRADTAGGDYKRHPRPRRPTAVYLLPCSLM